MNKWVVPFVGYRQNYKRVSKETLKAIDRCLKNGDLYLRKDTEDFEKNIAKYVDTKYAVSVGSGTDALIFSLKAAGIGKGDEVIVPGHTFWATIEAVYRVGAKPIMVDVADDGLIDLSLLKRNLTKKTKAIIPVHLNGVVCEMERILKIAKKYNLIVIEDACQSLGAERFGKRAGSFGLTGCFSVYPAKILGSYGDGGFVTTNSKKIANEIKMLRNHGMLGLNKETHRIGTTSCMDNIQAAVLNVKLRYLDKDIKRRQEIGIKYASNFYGFPSLLDHMPVFQNFVLITKQRDKLYKFLKLNGIETLKNEYSFLLKKPPRATLIEKTGLRLPLYPEMTNQQVDYVINKINEFFNR